ncbi:MAG: VTT domain-containing protein [Bacteroidetes bacterium]|jgi:membrane-associated protein|nr:VTT domain-containing protein [Bacteroidota bacterium]MCA6442264.1 VTT domain-containing protein [Bacteroidota bacterium]
MWDFLKQLTDPNSIIQFGGLGLLLFVIFAETGLLVGFFLPGDNLILLAGILCKSKPELLGVNYIVMVTLMVLAAVSGNLFGYWFGYKSGVMLFKREDGFLFKKKHLETTELAYNKYGGNLVLIIARFLPVVRTFAPILAGAIKVDFKKFMLFNILGAVFWIVGLTAIGYVSVILFPSITNYLSYVFIALIILTALPIIRLRFIKKNN